MKKILLLLWLMIPGSLIAQTSVTLQWDANVETYLAGYNIYRSNVPGSYGSPLNTVLLTMPSYIDSGFATGMTYYWVVKAVATDGTLSNASNEVTLNIVSDQTTVSNLKGTCDVNGNVSVSWSPLAGASSYYLRIQLTTSPPEGPFIAYEDMYMQTLWAHTNVLVPAGQTLHTWVHWANAAGTIMNAAHLNFTCPQGMKAPANLKGAIK